MQRTGWFTRKSGAGAARTEDFSDVFMQPSGGLLTDALRRPVGLAALGGMALAGVALYTGQPFQGALPTPYLLVLLFVAAAAFLAVVLRGETRPARRLARAKVAGEAVEQLPRRAAGEGEPRSRRRSAAQAGQARSAASVEAAAPAPARRTVKRNSFEGYRKALLHFQNANDPKGQGQVLRQLGQLAKDKGRLEDSRDCLINARNCFRQVGDGHSEAAVLLELGHVLERLGDQETAGAAYREANRSLLHAAIDGGKS